MLPDGGNPLSFLPSQAEYGGELRHPPREPPHQGPHDIMHVTKRSIISDYMILLACFPSG